MGVAVCYAVTRFTMASYQRVFISLNARGAYCVRLRLSLLRNQGRCCHGFAVYSPAVCAGPRLLASRFITVFGRDALRLSRAGVRFGGCSLAHIAGYYCFQVSLLRRLLLTYKEKWLVDSLLYFGCCRGCIAVYCRLWPRSCCSLLPTHTLRACLRKDRDASRFVTGVRIAREVGRPSLPSRFVTVCQGCPGYWRTGFPVAVCYRALSGLGVGRAAFRVSGCYRSRYLRPSRFITHLPLLDHGMTSRFIPIGALAAVAACYRFRCLASRRMGLRSPYCRTWHQTVSKHRLHARRTPMPFCNLRGQVICQIL